jgi:hypothetical protein
MAHALRVRGNMMFCSAKRLTISTIWEHIAFLGRADQDWHFVWFSFDH